MKRLVTMYPTKKLIKLAEQCGYTEKVFTEFELVVKNAEFLEGLANYNNNDLAYQIVHTKGKIKVLLFRLPELYHSFEEIHNEL